MGYKKLAVTLLLGLTVFVETAFLLASSPTGAMAETKTLQCPNTNCGDPEYCVYRANRRCFLTAGSCTVQFC